MKVLHLTITPLVLLSFVFLCESATGAKPPKVLYLDKNKTLQEFEPP